MSNFSKTTNLINTINEIIEIGKNREIVHQYTKDTAFDGRQITIKEKPVINFGSCSYLGFEIDSRLKDAGIDAITRYGSQFSCSRTYVSCTLYEELEELIGKLFNAPFLLSTSSTLGHQAVVPIVVEDNDAVVLDHQAHVSMQDATKKLQLRGVPITMLRHSRMDELQQKVNELTSKHNKIWYFIDSVYSMYGDLAPIDELMNLLEVHPQLHLYVDDAHGMSWAGLNGSGFFLSKTQLHPKVILATSLAKGFASAGGVFIFPSQDLCNKVKNWGGPLTYSGPQQPAVLGASIASAKIHLTDEIYERQRELSERIDYTNKLLKEYNLPLVADSKSPIFFIGLGLTKVGYNMVRRMMDEGFYVNLGIFPAVPETCTGIRFTITLNHTFNDIENLVKALAYHLPQALKEEERTMEDIFRAFRSITKFPHITKAAVEVNSDIASLKYKLEHTTSIQSIPKSIWDTMFTGNSFDWEGLAFLEKVFSNNALPEHNWNFHYYLIKDIKDKILAATFFTEALVKEDMFAPSSVSEEIEEERKSNPYYLTSKAFMMGSLLTEGQHLYIDRSQQDWKDYLVFLLNELWNEQERQKNQTIYLRDFDLNDVELRGFLTDQGFIKIEVPDTHIMDNINWTNKDEYLLHLPGKKRNRIRREVLKYEHCFEVNIRKTASEQEIDYWYSLYENIKNKNLSLNVFELPRKFFHEAVNNTHWEIIELKLKPEFDNRAERLPVAVGYVYITKESYCPIALGLDYSFHKFNLYRQMIFQAITRASDLHCKMIHFGLTATEDKQKFGIKAVPKVAFIQMKDNFNSTIINMIPNNKKKWGK